MDNSPNQHPGKKDTQLSYPGKMKIPKLIVSINEKVFLLVILALAVYYFLPKISSLEESLKVFSSLNNWALLLAIVAQFMSYYVSGLTISECVELSGKRINIWRGILIFTASTSIGLVAGGMFASAASIFRWIKASGGDNESSSMAASLLPIFLDIVLIGISIIGLVFLFFIHNLSKTQLVFFFLITFLLVAFCILFIIAVRHKEQAIRILVKIAARLYKIVHKDLPKLQFTDSIQHLFSTWEYLIHRGWEGPLFGSSLNIIFDMLILFFVFLSAGKVISPFVLIAGYGLPWLFGRMAFIFPGGVGIIENTMVAMYTSLGIESSLATVVVLTYRVISFWFPSIIGFVILPFLNNISNENRIMQLQKQFVFYV